MEDRLFEAAIKSAAEGSGDFKVTEEVNYVLSVLKNLEWRVGMTGRALWLRRRSPAVGMLVSLSRVHHYQASALFLVIVLASGRQRLLCVGVWRAGGRSITWRVQEGGIPWNVQIVSCRHGRSRASTWAGGVFGANGARAASSKINQLDSARGVWRLSLHCHALAFLHFYVTVHVLRGGFAWCAALPLGSKSWYVAFFGSAVHVRARVLPLASSSLNQLDVLFVIV
jgi:hypothetical protein